MDEVNQGVTEREVAAPVTETQTQTEANPDQAQQSGVAAPTQDKETNAAFAQMRREAEQAKKDRDAFITEVYGHQGITSWDQYQQAKAQAEAQQKAQEMNVDPRFYQEFEGLKSKLNSFETERQQLQREKTLIEQEKTLESDPNVGELFKQWKSDVKQLAEQTGSDYDIAFTLMLRNKLPELLNSTKSTAEQDAVKKLISNSQSSPGSLGQSGDAKTSSIASMSKADFAKMQEQVLRGERKQI